MKTKTERPNWLRVQQAADLLDVSPSTVRRWAADGRLACRRTPGGQRRFLRDDLATLDPGAATRLAPRPKATGGGSGSGGGHDTGGPTHRGSSGDSSCSRRASSWRRASRSAKSSSRRPDA
jgi:excisionase family DNA binding protein